MQPTIENNVYYSFGPKSLTAKIVRGLTIPVIIFMITFLLTLLGSTSFFESIQSTVSVPLMQYIVMIGVGLGVLVALYQIAVAYLRYTNNTFMISDNALYLRNGILARTEISVPLRHMSNLLQNQTISDRILGVCRAQIEIQEDEVSSVTTSTSVPDDVILYDVDMSLIAQLRELLLTRSNTQRMVVVNQNPGSVSNPIPSQQ